MNELLTSSLIWRVCAAVAAFLSRSFLGRFARLLGRLWRQSAIYGLFARLLGAPAAADTSVLRRVLDGCNALLRRIGHGFVSVLRGSLCCRIYGAVVRYCGESLFLSIRSKCRIRERTSRSILVR